MKSNLLNCVFVFGAFLCSISSLSAQTLYKYSFHTDQDAFAKAYNQDRNYTMGFGLSASMNEKTDKSWLIAPALRKGCDWLLGLDRLNKKQAKDSLINQDSLKKIKSKDIISRFSLLGNGFTPFDIGVPGFQVGDRPYASLLVLGSERIRVFNEDREIPQTAKGLEAYVDNKPFAISTGLFVGFLGLGVGGEVQSYIHREQLFGTTRPVPLGWDTQISNGGELTAMYQINFISSLAKANSPNREGFKLMETSWDVGAQVGYYTNLNAGVNIKLGFFDAPFYENQGLLNAVSQAATEKRPCISWYVFSALRSRLVYYNGLLQGQFKENDYELTKSEIEPIVFEAELGVTATFYDHLQIVYKPLVIRTQEFKSAGRDHIWANITATLIVEIKGDEAQ